MDFVLLSGTVHADHDPDWAIYSPHYNTPVCLGCIMEILESPKLLPIMKKPALTEMLRLLTHQGTELIQMFKRQEAVVWLLHNILVENLCIEEESCVALSIDTLVRLVQQVGSEDLLAALLESLSHQVDRIREPSQLLPQYTLLGKMLHQLPGLASTLLTRHAEFVHHLSLDLCGPGEATQSALAYIFIYLCEGSCVPLWSPRLIQQVQTGMLKLLSTTGTLSVQINGLGLLKKLLSHDMQLETLMSRTVDGAGVLSVMKKLLLTKKGVLQIGVCQALVCLLTQAQVYGPTVLDSDIAEFLFEALHTQNIEQMEVVLQVLHHLSCLDLFYRRCHAVYGIESILHGLTTATEMNHPGLLQKGLALITELLNRQPQGIPLFVSRSLVQKTLQLIHAGLDQQLPEVKLAAQLCLTAILRKEHLLMPVPFSDLFVHISMVTDWVWSQVCDGGCTQGVSHRPMTSLPISQDHPLPNYIQLMLQATRLALHCKGDQKLYESTFTAPGADTHCSLTQFIQALLQTCDEAAVPLIMMCWDKLEPHSQKLCLMLMCHLHDLDSTLTSDLLYKMVEVGFINCVLEAKVQNSDPQMNSISIQYLHNAIDSCRSHDLIPREVTTDILVPEHTLKWTMVQLPDVLQKRYDDLETVHVYLLLLYLSYRHHNRVLSGEELAEVITSLATMTGIQKLNHLGKKQFIFLLAYAGVSEEIKLEECMPLGVSAVTSILIGPASEWYTHDPVFLHWCCVEPFVMQTAGYNVLEAYLHSMTIESLQQELRCRDEGGRLSEGMDTDLPVDLGHVVLSFCQHQSVRHLLLLSLATQKSDLLIKLHILMMKFLENTKFALKPTDYTQGHNNGEVPTQDKSNSGHKAQDKIDSIDKTQNSEAGDLDSIQSVELNMEKSESERDGKILKEILKEVTDVLLNVFLKNIQQAEANNIRTLLDIFVICRKECPGEPIDIKLFCHVIHLLTKREGDGQVKQSCLDVICTIVTQPGAAEHQIYALVAQTEDLMAVLQHCIDGHYGNTGYIRGCEILAALLREATTKPGPVAVTLPTVRLVQTMWHGLICEQVASLSLLAALFQSGSTQGLVRLEGTLTRAVYRNIFVCLQQLAVNPDADLSEKAITCMNCGVKYLMKLDHSLGVELLVQPWNTCLLSAVLELLTDGHASHHHAILLQLFTEYPEGINILRSLPDFDDSLMRALDADMGAQHSMKEMLKQVLGMLRSSNSKPVN